MWVLAFEIIVAIIAVPGHLQRGVLIRLIG